MTFGQELVVLHAIPSVYGQLAVHAWSQCGGFNKEHSMLAH